VIQLIDFHVKDTLPDISFPLPTSFAGSLSVNRQGHPDNALFFWAFESSPGSLAAQPGEQQDRPWAVWLNGG
jgi:carboxypeptidase D